MYVFVRSPTCTYPNVLPMLSVAEIVVPLKGICTLIEKAYTFRVGTRTLNIKLTELDRAAFLFFHTLFEQSQQTYRSP